MINVSTRTGSWANQDVIVGQFSIEGAEPKKLLLRGIGPSLAQAGMSGVMADPTLTVYDSKGNVVAQNDNWTSNQQEVEASGLAPANDRESAIATKMAPGAYTAIVKDATIARRFGVFELCDIEAVSPCALNVSTRGKVERAGDAIVGGFIVGGSQSAKVLVRALGPSLHTRSTLGALPDPVLELRNSNGSLIFSNNNWRRTQETQIIASGLAPSNDKESAISATLQPGSYIVVVRGANDTTGVAVAEVYSQQ